MPVALAVVGTVELAALGTAGWVAAAGLEVAAAGALAFRRAWPLVAAPVAAILILVIPYTGTRMDEPATPIIFYIVAIYSLGRYAGRRGGPVASVLTLLLLFADLYFVNSDDNDVTDVMFVLSLAVPPYVFGRVTRRLAEQSELLERQQAADPRPGGPRRAGPDRPRAARRDRPLGERDGGADGGRPGPASAPSPDRAAALLDVGRRGRPARRSPRPGGCCT